MKKYPSLKKYFSLDGRAKRSEYWAMLLISSICGFFSLLILYYGNITPLTLLLAVTFILSSIWLALTVTVRRIRDAGINMRFVIFAFIPIVSTFTGIYWGCVKSKK